MNRNLNVRNFGLRSRDATRALMTAYQMKGNGYASNATVQSALRAFTRFLKENYLIKDLRKVEQCHVKGFAEQLNDRYERGEISASTVQNYLSPVNVAMENARLDTKCRVEGVREAGLPTRTGIATQDQSATLNAHKNALQSVSERLGIQLNLQRELGLRLKESCLMDAKQALNQALTKQNVRIEQGTKGGRPRDVPIHAYSQIEALQRAVMVQRKDSSLIPEHQTWAQYQSQVYRELTSQSLHCHQERHHFANAMYERLMGVKSPVQSGISHQSHHAYLASVLSISKSEAKVRDEQVRLCVAEALGHSRISITNNYLG
ncbi:integrase domain-containing protein [Vibrio sp. PNB22_2_2]|uniref:integrase domain-containing protein n=1 Tax=unclassified Vibrio TaxID=2614977 RepID=UPI00406A5864